MTQISQKDFEIFVWGMIFAGILMFLGMFISGLFK